MAEPLAERLRRAVLMIASTERPVRFVIADGFGADAGIFGLLCHVLGVLGRQAPVAREREIGLAMLPAIDERDQMLQRPAFACSDLAVAAVAFAFAAFPHSEADALWNGLIVVGGDPLLNCAGHLPAP